MVCIVFINNHFYLFDPYFNTIYVDTKTQLPIDFVDLVSRIRSSQFKSISAGGSRAIRACVTEPDHDHFSEESPIKWYFRPPSSKIKKYEYCNRSVFMPVEVTVENLITFQPIWKEGVDLSKGSNSATDYLLSLIPLTISIGQFKSHAINKKITEILNLSMA